MKIESISDVMRALMPFYGVAKETIKKDITVDRMQRLMAHIGNPEQRLKVIHVAGTSGKTSTSYYIAAMFNASGQSVGLSVSPHVDSLAERVQIGGRPISEKTFCSYMEKFLKIVDDAPETPSWHELVVAFALWVFAEENVDYVVLETGLGGLHDSTNVTERSDKVCVLTDIGYDHMNVLGTRLGSIAHQKAGIVHPGNAVIMYDQGEEIMNVVRFWVSQQEEAELYTFTQTQLLGIYARAFPLSMPVYQQRNWLLGLAVYKFVSRRDELPEASLDVLESTLYLQVPGRMDERDIAGKKIIMDGAHNVQKMTAFLSSLAKRYPHAKPVMLLALKEGKEIEEIAPMLAKAASKIIVTAFVHSQDLPTFAMKPNEISSVLKANGAKKVVIVPDITVAYDVFMQSVEGVGVITGSFYLLAQLRSEHKELR